jgi:hypothetical protein
MAAEELAEVAEEAFCWTCEDDCDERELLDGNGSNGSATANEGEAPADATALGAAGKSGTHDELSNPKSAAEEEEEEEEDEEEEGRRRTTWTHPGPTWRERARTRARTTQSAARGARAGPPLAASSC